MVGTGSNKIGEAEQNEHLFVRQSRRSAGCDGRAAATGRPQPRTALLSRCGALSARRRPGQGRLAGAAARPVFARSWTRLPARAGWQLRGKGSRKRGGGGIGEGRRGGGRARGGVARGVAGGGWGR